jgi:DNA-binding beta-propeller fold protein YncE
VRSGAVQRSTVNVGFVSCLGPASSHGLLLVRSAVALVVAGSAAGCGAASPVAGRTATATDRSATATVAARAAPTTPPRRNAPIRLRLAAGAALPAPVQLPGLARTADGRVIAVGGLDAADVSVADVIGVLPGRARRIGRMPQAAHDIGVTALGRTVYAFGGGTAAGPVATITAFDAHGRARVSGRLPVAMSDTTAVTLGRTAYVVGGYTTTTPLRSVLAFRPGRGVRVAAGLPYPVRYAAAAAIGARIYVAGGTTGTRARREIVEVDPVAHRSRVVGRLPAPLAHAAGAALGGRFYVLGGRGDALSGQQATIWAFDPTTRRLRRAGRLPLALSDLAAVVDGDRIVAVGGRDRQGRVHAERWSFAESRRESMRARPRPAAAAARIPRLLDRHDVYAAGRPGHLAPAARHVPARVYVPNSQSATVDVIDQRTGRIVRHFAVGRLPQHVTPSWDLRTLWVTNDLGNSLTPIDPRTSRPGKPVAVDDPYNLYFTADGRRAIVVAEARRELDFRDPHTMAMRHSLKVPTCRGVDHMDFTRSGRRALVSCEFAGSVIEVDLRRERVMRTIELRAGAMPQDIKLSPDGRTFYVADMQSGGVWEISARTFRKIRFQPTGKGAHGLYPSRDSKTLFVSNRGEGSISLISFRTRRPYRKWHIPGGGSPDMGGLSASGRVLWLSGRYNAEVYAISTRTGRLLRRIKVGAGPHGLAVWPQPGRYSIGHTGILR